MMKTTYKVVTYILYQLKCEVTFISITVTSRFISDKMYVTTLNYFVVFIIKLTKNSLFYTAHLV